MFAMALTSHPRQIFVFFSNSSQVYSFPSNNRGPSSLRGARLLPYPHTAAARSCLKLEDNFPPTAASAGGVPSELMEDSKFVPLNAEDLRYGPPAMLLVGFNMDEAVQIQQLLKDMDGEFLKLVYCTQSMVTSSLWEAVNTIQPDVKSTEVAVNMPRICFLSGLTGEEMIMFIDAFPETGLEPAVFAALVPNSADKAIEELIEEIMGDHEMLTGKSETNDR